MVVLLVSSWWRRGALKPRPRSFLGSIRLRTAVVVTEEILWGKPHPSDSTRGLTGKVLVREVSRRNQCLPDGRSSSGMDSLKVPFGKLAIPLGALCSRLWLPIVPS